MAEPQIIPVPRKAQDLTGKKFTRLLVLRIAKIENGVVFWLCRCDCGKERVVRANSLRRDTKSCGCYTKDRLRQRGKDNPGVWKHPGYKTWGSMMDRCYKTRYRAYPLYGGRGIKVCERWRTSWRNLWTDMGAKPAVNYSLDRIDNDGHYSCGQCEECKANGWPMNCRWATMKQQSRNKRGCRYVTFRGETFALSEWAERLGLNYATLLNRIHRGWPVERALTEPVNKLFDGSRFRRK